MVSFLTQHQVYRAVVGTNSGDLERALTVPRILTLVLSFLKMSFFCNVIIKQGHDRWIILQMYMGSLGSLPLFYRQTIFIDKQEFAWNFPEIFVPQFQRTNSSDCIWQMLRSYSLSCTHSAVTMDQERGDWDYLCVLIFSMSWWILYKSSLKGWFLYLG